MSDAIVKYSKEEIIEKMVELTDGDITKADAGRALSCVTDAFTSLLVEGTESGDVCSLFVHNLGTFNVIRTKARKGRNIRTGEPLDIPASRKLTFSPASGLKKAIKSVE